MESVTMTSMSSEFQALRISSLSVRILSLNSRSNVLHYPQHYPTRRLFLTCNPGKKDLNLLSKPTSLASSGLEASITDPKDSAISLRNVEIVVESQDENKMQLRVDLTADETQKVFDKVLANLAKSAPPIPGFRRTKGGKTSNVPKSFLLDILGKERVTKFVIQEILTSTMADYAIKENLKVKDKKIDTTQSAKELEASFTPGKEFGFNVVLELETSETAETSETKSS